MVGWWNTITKIIERFLEEISDEKLHELIEAAFLTACREKKNLHVRKEFLIHVERVVDPRIYKKFEELLPKIILELRNRGIIETDVGPEGVDIGDRLPVAYVRYVDKG